MRNPLGKAKSEEHVKVRASLAVTEIDYTQSNILRVFMTDGSVLEYADVPREVFEAFQKAESKGRFFNAHVRNNYSFIS